MFWACACPRAQHVVKPGKKIFVRLIGTPRSFKQDQRCKGTTSLLLRARLSTARLTDRMHDDAPSTGAAHACMRRVLQVWPVVMPLAKAPVSPLAPSRLRTAVGRSYNKIKSKVIAWQCWTRWLIDNEQLRAFNPGSRGLSASLHLSAYDRHEERIRTKS